VLLLNIQRLREMVGKMIRNKWKDDDDERWYFGTILDLVPGTKDWYNIKHDNEDDNLSLNMLLDIDRGDLEFIE